MTYAVIVLCMHIWTAVGTSRWLTRTHRGEGHCDAFVIIRRSYAEVRRWIMSRGGAPSWRHNYIPAPVVNFPESPHFFYKSVFDRRLMYWYIQRRITDVPIYLSLPCPTGFIPSHCQVCNVEMRPIFVVLWPTARFDAELQVDQVPHEPNVANTFTVVRKIYLVP